MGTLPREVNDQLAEAKSVAAKARRVVPSDLANGDVLTLVSMDGAYGGFIYVFDTGELGARYSGAPGDRGPKQRNGKVAIWQALPRPMLALQRVVPVTECWHPSYGLTSKVR
jgi:hypothetical protein